MAGLLDWGAAAHLGDRAAARLLAADAASQLVEGNLRQATARVREGGWAVISRAIAEEHHLHIGDAFTLPTPDPIDGSPVAALSTNIGWAPGAIDDERADDYAHAWESEDASAYNVLLDPGVAPGHGSPRDRTARSGRARAGRADRRAARRPQRALTRQGLARLSQIATLILIAAILAMAAAMGDDDLAASPAPGQAQARGLPATELWRTIMLESFLLVGVGCTSGAIFGLFGQQLLDRALANVIGFPVVYSFGALVAVASLALVTAASVLIVALPGYLATEVLPGGRATGLRLPVPAPHRRRAGNRRRRARLRAVLEDERGAERKTAARAAFGHADTERVEGLKPAVNVLVVGQPAGADRRVDVDDRDVGSARHAGDQRDGRRQL